MSISDFAKKDSSASRTASPSDRVPASSRSLPQFSPSPSPIEQLIEVVQSLSLAQTLGEIMSQVRTTARRLTGADGATFVLRDNDHCFYAEEDAIAPLWKGQRFPCTCALAAGS
jgi:hypothetical protein